jgi:UDP-N-acetylmuramate dehydrogenase
MKNQKEKKMIQASYITKDKTIIDEIKQYGNLIVNASLKEFTTFKTGGIADLLIIPNNSQDVANIVKLSERKSLPLTIIGGGSNLLVGDKGIRGIVICMSSDNYKHDDLYFTDDNKLYASAIVKKEDFINFAVENGCGGIEFIVGVPGCIGGGIIMNAGTFMGSFVDILNKVVYIDKNGNTKEKEITNNMANYRFFSIDDAVVILGGYFKLPKNENISEIKKKIEDIHNDRKSKHPLQYPCAGSVFKNPEGHQSWKLVDDSGLKGMKIGDAMVSEMHTNFIINMGNATSRDVRDLIEVVQAKVFEKFNIELHTEIRMIGEF